MKNLVKQNTCFKNSDKLTCIDLILTNCPRSFQNTDTFETGLSDFHKLTFTVLKHIFQSKNLTLLPINNIKFSDFFRIELENALLKYGFNNIHYDNFIKTFPTVLVKHAPIKEQYLRENDANFGAKQLRKIQNYVMIFSKIEMLLPKVLTENNATYAQPFCEKLKSSISRI